MLRCVVCVLSRELATEVVNTTDIYHRYDTMRV